MRWVCTVLVALLASVPPGQAQSTGLKVDLVMDESNFLPGEEILVGARISNLSGRPLTFGTTTNWLAFYVETKRGDSVERLGQVPVEGEFTLESAKAGTKWWNIQPHFDLQESGPYVVYVELQMPEWDQRLLSEGTTFTIQPARKIWEVSFGVPPVPGQADGLPEIRRYALQSAIRGKERKLFARVTDANESVIYRVVLLDRLLSFAEPETQLDNTSRLHVLFQTGGNTYTFCVLDPNGDLVIRQRHQIAPGSRPRLAKAADGSIEIQGGRRLPTPSDIPPYEPPPVTVSAAIPPSAAVTNPPAGTEDGKGSRSARRKQRQAPASN